MLSKWLSAWHFFLLGADPHLLEAVHVAEEATRREALLRLPACVPPNGAQRRSRKPQAHPKRHRNRLHLGKRTRRKHRRAA